MQHLPTAEEQSWLIDRLSGLMASRGEAQFIEMPIVEPRREFFPDHWTFSHRGLDRLVRRLMQYAGLGHLGVRIGTYVELAAWNEGPMLHGHRSTAGLFMGIVDGQCLFAFNEKSPSDAEYMAGVMCHEVAHAYRAHHGLVEPGEVQEEELLTDLTTVYLGFGLLSANNSFRYRTAGWNTGALAYHSWTVQSAGYLPPQAFAFLLALQMVARDLSKSERGRLLDQLEADQSAFTEAALRAVWDRPTDITRILGMSPRPHDAASTRLEDILLPLPDFAEPESASASTVSESEPLRFNQGRPVFRVPKNRIHQFGPSGALVGAPIGAIGAFAFHQWAIFLCGAILGAAWGIYRGSKARFEVCSDSGCRAILSPSSHCPNCGGFIAGSIRHENDRFDAEELWQRQAGSLGAERPKARKIRRAKAGEESPE